MNIDDVIFDAPGKRTINGIPAGYLSPNYPRLVLGDGKPQPIDIAKIVDVFHTSEEGLVCAYTGKTTDGVNVVDGNPNNFLITNLEPVSREYAGTLSFVPKFSVARKYTVEMTEYEVELYGIPHEQAIRSLEKLYIPVVPGSSVPPFSEMGLLWVWNELTKVQLLKGLTTLTIRSKELGIAAKLTNVSVMEFIFRALHFDIKENTDAGS